MSDGSPLLGLFAGLLLAAGLFLGQSQNKLPLGGRDGRDAEAGLAQGLQVGQRASGCRVGFEVGEGDEAGEFVAEGDVDEIPLGVVVGGFVVVVGVGGVERGFCGRQSVCWWIGRRGAGGHTVGGVLLHDFHDADNPRHFAVGVVEEGLVALFHGAQVFPSCLVSVDVVASGLDAGGLPTGLRMPVDWSALCLDETKPGPYHSTARAPWPRGDHQWKT